MIILLPIVSSLLLYLANPNILFSYGLWPLAWIFAVPLLYVMDHPSLLRRLGGGVVFGLVFYSLLVYWFIPYTQVGYIFFVLSLFLQMLFFSLFFSLRYNNKIIKFLYWPALWVAGEYVRVLFMKGFTWDLGHSQAFNMLGIQSVSLLGSSGLSFIIFLFNVCIYRLLKGEDRRLYGITVVFIILLVAGSGYYALHSYLGKIAGGTDRRIQVATIQPNIPPQEKINRQKIYQQIDKQIALSRAIKQKTTPDLIIWPETSIPSDFLKFALMNKKIRDLAAEMQTHLLLGGALRKDNKPYNTAVLMNKGGEVLGRYHKRFLVPFSEYMPPGALWAYLKEILQIHNFEFMAGDKLGLMTFTPNNQIESRAVTFGVLICNEDTIGSLFREYSLSGAEMVVVMLNDGWFDMNIALIMHAQNTVVHAVENRLSVVRAANTGWSTYIDPYGRIFQNSVPFKEKAFAIHSVVLNREKTLYNIIGDSFCRLCLGFVIMIFGLGLLKKRKIS